MQTVFVRQTGEVNTFQQNFSVWLRLKETYPAGDRCLLLLAGLNLQALKSGQHLLGRVLQGHAVTPVCVRLPHNI